VSRFAYSTVFVEGTKDVPLSSSMSYVPGETFSCRMLYHVLKRFPPPWTRLRAFVCRRLYREWAEQGARVKLPDPAEGAVLLNLACKGDGYGPIQEYLDERAGNPDKRDTLVEFTLANQSLNLYGVKVQCPDWVPDGLVLVVRDGGGS